MSLSKRGELPGLRRDITEKNAVVLILARRQHQAKHQIFATYLSIYERPFFAVIEKISNIFSGSFETKKLK